MHYFSNKIFKNRQDLKMRDLSILWFLKLIMTKSNFKKIGYDTMLVMSSLLRHR